MAPPFVAWGARVSFCLFMVHSLADEPRPKAEPAVA